MKTSFIRASTIVALCLLGALTFLPASTSAVVIRGPDNVERHAVEVRESSLAVVDLVQRSSSSALEARLDPTIATAAFNTVAKITELVCTFSGPIGCLAAGVVAVFGIFFTIYRLTSRTDLAHTFHLETDYPALPGCGVRCRLNKEVPEGDWSMVGNATVNGLFHTMHFKKNGTISGVRSIQHGPVSSTSGIQARQQQDNDGGVVVDYYWFNNNENAYDSFDSYPAEVSQFADDAVNTMVDTNDIEECASFTDSDGVLAPGLLAVGWNNAPFEFQDGQNQADLNYCQSEAWGK
jgi:hypothetical protein